MTEDSLSIDPLLAPGGVTAMKFRGITYKLSVFSAEWSDTSMSLDVLEGCIEVISADSANNVLCASGPSKLMLSRGKIVITDQS